MDNNSRMAWRGIKTMIGQSNQPNIPDHSAEEANALNRHFARWESDLRPLPNWQDNATGSAPISVCSREVEWVFSQVKPRKAAGPDKLPSMVLRACHEQLSHVFCDLFQKSLDTHTVPKIWKTAEILPLPKKPKPSVLNDFRPVALTSVAMLGADCSDPLEKN